MIYSSVCLTIQNTSQKSCYCLQPSCLEEGGGIRAGTGGGVLAGAGGGVRACVGGGVLAGVGVLVGADRAPLVGGSSELAHKGTWTSGVRPLAPIPPARTAVAFERVGTRRRRSRARPAVDPADEEGGADRLCWGG